MPLPKCRFMPSAGPTFLQLCLRRICPTYSLLHKLLFASKHLSLQLPNYPDVPGRQRDTPAWRCVLVGGEGRSVAENSSAGGLRHMVPLTFSAVMGACWQPHRGHEPGSTRAHSVSPPSLLCLIISLSTPIHCSPSAPPGGMEKEKSWTDWMKKKKIPL